MKKQLIAVAILAMAALPVGALTAEVEMAARHEMKLKQRIGELELRVSTLEKKMTHVVNILKLQRENKASGRAAK